MTDSAEKLLPCPFCGNEAERDTWDKARDYAGCRSCDFWVSIAAWNRRAHLSAHPVTGVWDANSGWMPIESAPRDGREILAFNGEVDRMHWIYGEGYALFAYADNVLAEIDPEPEQPTHWQPLPAAPMTAASGMDERE